MNRFISLTLFLLAFAGAVLAQGTLPTEGLIHQFTFDDANNLEHATVGTDLARGNRAQYQPVFNAVNGYDAADGAVEVGLGSYYSLELGLDPNGADTAKRVNEFSFVIDFYCPGGELWYGFHASDNDGDPEANDWDSFLNSGMHLGVGTTGYSYYSVQPGEWYRLVISADLGTQYKYFLDGQLAQDGGTREVDDRLSLPSIDGANTVLFFGDNDEEDANIYISQLAVYDRPLTDEEVYNLGGWNHFITMEKPVGQWGFDDAVNLLDPLYGEALTLVGNHDVAVGPSSADGAVKIGSGSYYEAVHNINANKGGELVNEYTLAFDIQIPATGNVYSLYQTDASNSNDAELKINAEGQLGSDETGYLDSSLVPGDWYKVVIAASMDNYYKIYIDGDSLYDAGALDLDGRYAISARTGDNKVLFFADDNGEDSEIIVANVSLYNRALDGEEILGLGAYEHGEPNNEKTGATKSVYFSSSAMNTYGKVEKTNDDFDFGSGNFTIEVWTKPDFNFDSDPSLLGDKNWDSGGNPGWVISVRPGDNDWKFNAADQDRNRYDVNGPKINDGNWHHLAVIANQDSGLKLITDDLASIWADGGNGAFFNCDNIDSELPLCFANEGSEVYSPFYGEIDEVRIWKGVAIPQEVIREWRHKKITEDHPYYEYLTGYWTFDEGSGTSVADLSGRGHNMELIGAPKWEVSYAVIGEEFPFKATYGHDVQAVWGASMENNSGGMILSGEFPYPQATEMNMSGNPEYFTIAASKEDNPYAVFGHNEGVELNNELLPSGVEASLRRAWFIDASEVSMTNPVVKFDFSDLGISAEPGDVANYVLLKRMAIDQQYAVVAEASSKDGDEVIFTPEEISYIGLYTIGTKSLSASGFGSFIVSVEEDATLPAEFGLSNNYPNPFNPSTNIEFALPVAAKVNVSVYNILGQLVQTIVNKDLAAGYHKMEWNTSGENSIASGMYIYRINAVGVDGREFTNSKKMLLLK